ncbi:alpha-glucosidase C-terminal domain-containing protein [Bacteroidales bacterium OttesenSCG-928-K03]|nr:alpha-glucosidase C-terminal domain-containing protein [Bacteroidales bacterium OttesenSCG-928-L14]MDL2240397.1 alpha-glucosidase C-terminal domain-containing protein [Bacteroidales bacterium OttesenSCG-928-K22]MDL2242372.1 alpha-glucosidase C-terminal domain-containing protein [Bacteroidales bacterium OttesenSCG-928-K03]
MQNLHNLWQQLYPHSETNILIEFISELEVYKSIINLQPLNDFWYKDAVVYSLYVDLFNGTFDGLIDKLDYLEELGINCLWLLPVLDSPMKDAGFDVRDFRKIRKSLLGDNVSNNNSEKLFENFIKEAHKRNFKIIFDLPLNHCSDEHQWFKNSKDDKNNEFRNYFIWNKDDKKYSEARVIFKGIEQSNWTKFGDEYYFHRFFEFQPDLNYRNPKLLLEMTRTLLFWLKSGVDGFRADAIPYLWKETGTDCENLDGTHLILKFMKAVLDYVRPNVLFLAEACQKPQEVVKYFGNADECNAAYHFPLMPMIYKAIASQNKNPIQSILDKKNTPEISEKSQWFLFLRCHDELSLEEVYVNENDRKYIYDNFCHNPKWDFRNGEGISARLSELMGFHPDKILLAYSIILTLPGTPIIYYGDEFAKANDDEYYNEQIKITGKNDTRFLVRGKIDWNDVEKSLKDETTISNKIFFELKRMINMRNVSSVFGRGSIEWIDVKNDSILAYYRIYENEKVLVLNNLSSKQQSFSIDSVGSFLLKGYGFVWRFY